MEESGVHGGCPYLAVIFSFFHGIGGKYNVLTLIDLQFYKSFRSSGSNLGKF
jgi:hypothetical protein